MRHSERLIEFRDKLRERATSAEQRLKVELDKVGLRYVFQEIIGIFIVDFLVGNRLVVEIDGGYHDDIEQEIRDRRREEWLRRKGYTVLRFKNETIFNGIGGVIEDIKNKGYSINGKKLPPRVPKKKRFIHKPYKKLSLDGSFFRNHCQEMYDKLSKKLIESRRERKRKRKRHHGWKASR